MNLKQVSYDLHLHSCLSPCGDDEMTPATIAGMAVLNGLQVVALTDHNSCRNCEAFLTACEFYGITGVPGMELTTEEEIHVVCLFPTLQDAMSFDAYVYDHLMDIKNEERIFGRQLVVNEDDEIVGKVDKLLINATDISFDKAFPLVESFNGVAFPAHLDKNTTSLISQLGFIPPESTFKTAEVKDLNNLHRLKKEHPYLNGCKIVTSSDAHYIKDINQASHTILVGELSAKGVVESLKKADF